jgi:hypothetical protein
LFLTFDCGISVAVVDRPFHTTLTLPIAHFCRQSFQEKQEGGEGSQGEEGTVWTKEEGSSKGRPCQRG